MTVSPAPEPLRIPESTPDGAAQWIEYYYSRGWSDGLPLVPPTEASVQAMLAAGGFAGGEVLGRLNDRNASAPVEKVAVNAVMAGCLPSYFPVVAAAVRGLFHPDFDYHGPASSTGGSALVIIVSGPISGQLHINAADNAFGSGCRANATIGRAVRLVMMNLLKARPGLLDRATLGTPGKYSFCFAEFDADAPWEPLHVERGLAPEQSAVTIYACNSQLGVYNQLAGEPEPLLLQFADALCNLASPNVRGFNENLVVMAGEHAQVIRKAGWTKRRVQEFLLEHARRRVADFKRAARLPGAIKPEDEHTWRYVMEKPEDVILVRAGGMAGSWSAVLPGWGKKWTRSITTALDLP
ncbi:MAG: hypothetical protein O7A08_04510 [SAR324 cluster bacterium]|nr:hypothetical protein [SAR324 cluster bacterium]MCZ6645376.1 hypothetical protein [SAR324 cluster bacterium]MCZ6730566.1 hypothetical protein [SAR324 cluster bacterium]